MEFVTALKRINPESFRGTRLYRARLSNQFVIFLYACDDQTLKGVFQPKAIRAAMITISINSRRMASEIARNAGGDQWNLLHRSAGCDPRRGGQAGYSILDAGYWIADS